LVENKKGISPLIATVLIIGFTIVLAVLVITWISGTVTTQTENTDCLADANSKCLDLVGSAIDVSDVWTGPTTSGVVTLTVRNEKSTPFNFDVIWLDASGNSVEQDLDQSVGAYSSTTLVSNVTAAATGPYETVKVLPKTTSDIAGGCTAVCDTIDYDLTYR